MCTAIAYQTKEHYFGRNMDYEFSYKEMVTVTPRNFFFEYRKVAEQKQHYAMIGMAYIVNDYPLYYDATNEHGVSMAGLNFPGNAVYHPEKEDMDNITPFEFIPWILGQCTNLTEVKELLSHMNLVNLSFSEELPLSPLHWIIADKEHSITVESVAEGLRIYENPVGVLTNNPPFDYHMFNLCNYMNLSKETAENRLTDKVDLKAYSRGMGAMGLPGDLSSASRFVKAVFTKWNSISGESENESVSQFFHILGSVEQQRGCVHMGNDMYEITLYSSCCNVDKGIYYYITYDNRQINGVDMHKEDLNGSRLSAYPLLKEQVIHIQN